MSANTAQSCDFCLRLSDPSLRAGSWDFASVGSLPDFELIAAAAPVAVGHVLIVPRTHSLSFASLRPVMASQIESAIGAAVELFADGLTIAEHGMCRAVSANDCVEHAHLHLIPAPLPESAGIRSTGAEGSWIGLRELLGSRYWAGRSYVAHGTSPSALWIKESGASERHYIQRLLRPEVESGFWDYLLDPRPSEVAATVSAWAGTTIS